MRIRTLLATTLATVLGAGLTALTTAPPAQGSRAPTVDLQPDRLERGADVAVPHLEGRTIVDGTVRVTVRSDGLVVLLGKNASGYVVGTENARGRRPHIWRVSPDGTRTLLLSGRYASEAVLSDDGSMLVAARGYRPTAVTLVDTESARSLGTRRFAGSVTALDAHRNKVVLGSDRGTIVWNWKWGRVRTVTRRWGYRADVSADLLASYTEDPYLEGCTRVSRLSRPGRILWRSCRERVDTFSPDGRRMATIHILADGLGPDEVRQRRIRGRLLAHYTTSWFGLVRWEDPVTLLLDANGRRKAATVRCLLDVCENASDPVDTVQP